MHVHTGETFTSLQYLYRIPRQTISMIVQQTCLALIQVLTTDYLKVLEVMTVL